MTMSRLRNQCVVFERECGGDRDKEDRKKKNIHQRALQFIMEGFSLCMVQGSHQQQGSSSIVSNKDDEGVVSVKQLGLFDVLLLEICVSSSSLSSQLQGGPLEDCTQVEFPLALG